MAFPIWGSGCSVTTGGGGRGGGERLGFTGPGSANRCLQPKEAGGRGAGTRHSPLPSTCIPFPQELIRGVGDAGIAETDLSWISGVGGLDQVLICACYTEAASGSQQGHSGFLPVLLPCSAHHLLPPHRLRSPGSFSFPAKTPGCPSAGRKGGKGKEGRNARPHSSGGGVEAGMREKAKSLCSWAQT